MHISECGPHFKEVEMRKHVLLLTTLSSPVAPLLRVPRLQAPNQLQVVR